MRINFWCGRQVLDGWFNVDAVRHPKAPRDPELLHAFTFASDGALENPLPLQDGEAEELQAMHALEHVYAWEAPHLLAEWRRLLRPGGLLVLELPDLEHAARNLLAGAKDQLCMWPLYGDPATKDPYMCHRFGYTRRTLAQLLLDNGFDGIVHAAPRTHGARENRDMRVEARKS